MTFEATTISEILTIINRTNTETQEFAELRTRLHATMGTDGTEERILLTELANRVDRLTVSFAALCGVICQHLADEANLRAADD